MLTVHHTNGKAAVILSGTSLGGCMILNDTRGKIIASVPDPNQSDQPEDGEA